VAVYTQQAIETTARIAGVLKWISRFQSQYQQLSIKLAEKINQDFWDETEGSYCDFYGPRNRLCVQLKEQSNRGMRQEDSSNIRIQAYYEQLIKDVLRDACNK
jgi:hypothetical protein